MQPIQTTIYKFLPKLYISTILTSQSQVTYSMNMIINFTHMKLRKITYKYHKRIINTLNKLATNPKIQIKQALLPENKKLTHTHTLYRNKLSSKNQSTSLKQRNLIHSLCTNKTLTHTY